jgi:CheY-specific phosphatase CheX
MMVSDADIEDIVQAVWDSIFDLPIGSDRSARLGVDSTVTGCIQIDGAWRGAVLIQCPFALASTLTAVMFAADGAPPMEDVRDAIGELTNMVAGNIKSLLPERCQISLPAVALGSDQQFTVVGTEVVTSVGFSCDGLPLLITLLQNRPEGGGSAATRKSGS